MIVACTFSDNFTQNSCIHTTTRVDTLTSRTSFEKYRKINIVFITKNPLLSQAMIAHIYFHIRKTSGKIKSDLPYSFSFNRRRLWNLYITTDLYITKKSSVKLMIFLYRYPSNSKYMENNLEIYKPLYSEQFLPFPWPFVIWNLHCINKIR